MAVSLAALEARADDRDVVLRFIPVGEVIADGYRVYIGDETTGIEHLIDLGYVATDSDGIARSTVVLDSATSYTVGMTAYNGVAESNLSNLIVISALTCNASACDDGNPCTADVCDEWGCLGLPAADGSACDDGQVDTVDDVCISGVCRGSVPGDVLAVTGIAPDATTPGYVDVDIYGEGFAVGASLRFENGTGLAPRVRSLLLIDSRTLVARVEVPRQGPRRSRFWDVVVSLPDGTEARLRGALRVDP
jgi:hypothetical protein